MKKYGSDSARDMANDPNMGMNPNWRKKNPNGIKAQKFKVEYRKKKAK